MNPTTRCFVLMATLAWMTGESGQSKADVIVYAAGSATADSSVLGTLDLTTGQFSTTATVPIGINALTMGPDGTLFASAFDGHLYSFNREGTVTEFGSVTAPPGSPGGFQALAYSGLQGFYTYTIGGSHVLPFYNISSDGNAITTIGNLDATLLSGGGGNWVGGSNMAFGPDGTLYYCSGTLEGLGQLWSVNPRTGSVTPIGTGQGTPVGGLLELVSAGGQLYGINELGVSGTDYPIGIYTINITTGIVTATGVDVTGLPVGFSLDGAASVPEPSSLVLGFIGLGLAGGFVARKLRLREGRLELGKKGT